MYDISPSVTIDAPGEDVRNLLVDVEGSWVTSNPEHESLEFVSDNEELTAGTCLRVEERIAGIPRVAEGEVTSFVPGERVTVELTPGGERTELTVHVWASFPDTLFGRLVEWSFMHLLDGVDRDCDHAMGELEYLKDTLEDQ